jgi:hypothetical protein
MKDHVSPKATEAETTVYFQDLVENITSGFRALEDAYS